MTTFELKTLTTIDLSKKGSALSINSCKGTLGSLRLHRAKKKKKKCPSVRPVHDITKSRTMHFFSRTPAAREAVPSPIPYD